MAETLIEYEDTTQSGKTLYAVVRDASGHWWNGSTFEAYSVGDFANYAVALAEQGASGYFTGATPGLAAGPYVVGVRSKAGASPAPSDASLGGYQAYWDGSQWIVPTDPWGGVITAQIAAQLLRLIGAHAAGKRTSNNDGSQEVFTDAVDQTTVRSTVTNASRPATGTAVTRSVVVNP